MLKTRTDFWGAAFISSLGLSAALGCGSGDDTSDSEVAAANGEDDDTNDDDDAQGQDESDDDDDSQGPGEPSDDDDSQGPGEPATDDDDGGDTITIPIPPVGVTPTPGQPSTTSQPEPGPVLGSGGAVVAPGGAGGVSVNPSPGGAGGASTNPGGAGGATSSAGSGGSPPAPVSRCTDSKPVLAGDVPTGLEMCSDGVVHRPAAAECPNNLSSRTQPVDLLPPVEGGDLVAPGTCRTDADCTEAPYGHCTPSGQEPLPSCQYGCTQDADCGEGRICVCGPDIGSCRAATCATNADCDEGLLCAEWYDRIGIGCGEPSQYACQTADDACAVDEDCVDEGTGDSCAVVDGARACTVTPGVACGRPFLVEGEAVLAEARFGAAIEDTGFAATLPSAERELLCQHWTEIGLMEHASIAAFARFCLQLLQVGAPSELLAAAQTAMADETAHTELAFELASRYAGRSVSAGPLPVGGALSEHDLEAIVPLVIREGCLGETVAALEAVEARAHCTVPEVCEVLERIARDEQNHAALAWRFLSWAIGREPRLRAVAEREFERIAREPEGLPVTDGPDLRAHGALPQFLRTELRAAAIRDVVLPCARGLLSREPGRSRDARVYSAHGGSFGAGASLDRAGGADALSAGVPAQRQR